MGDTLTRNDVLAQLRKLLTPSQPSISDAGNYALATDRIAALALVLRELPAEPAPPVVEAPVVEAPVVEAAPAQDPVCPYPPVLTRWGWATWKWDTFWYLYVRGAPSFIVGIGEKNSVHVYAGSDGFGEEQRLGIIEGDPMPAILAALRELGSLPDEEVPNA